MAGSTIHPYSQPSGAPDALGRVEVHPGSGLVLRRHGVLLVVPVVEASAQDLVATMVDICADRRETDDRRHVRRLARLVTEDHAHRVPPFVCLTALGDHLLVMAHDAPPVLVDGQELDLSPGPESSGWVERPVAATFTSLSVRGPGAGRVEGRGAFSLDLLDGGVPGAGVTLHLPRATSEGASGTTPADRELTEHSGSQRAPNTGKARTVLRATPHTRIVGLAPRPPDQSRRRPPLPIGSPDRAGPSPTQPAGDGASPVTAAPVHVSGITCRCGEFTNPDLRECPSCGAPLDSSRPRQTRARPPLGILITDDGRVFTLTDDVVVGREPGQAPEVRAARARPLVLRDTEQSTSRVHAEIRLSGWEVDVVDRGSANGTFVSRSGAAGPWLPVPPGPGTALTPGDRLRLGKRELLFDRYRAL